MQKALFFLLCTLSLTSSFGQNVPGKKFELGLGLNYSKPVGLLKDTYSSGFGLNLIGKYNFTNSLSAFVEASGQLFNNTSVDDNDLNFPFIAGARFTYYGFFTSAGLGHSIWLNDFDGFTYDLQFGYGFGSINVLSHYTSSRASGNSLAYLGLKVYYMF